jgi:hypothetical protein
MKETRNVGKKGGGGSERPKGRNCLGNLGVDDTIILRYVLKKQNEDWIQLAQDRV